MKVFLFLIVSLGLLANVLGGTACFLTPNPINISLGIVNVICAVWLTRILWEIFNYE